ncbi:MAG: hypothetical protein Q8P35_03285 [Candidatus Yanofskybacteria bacterium]|nr:hypothetical protein [Candidatus Yanofskybacteria bacterium]
MKSILTIVLIAVLAGITLLAFNSVYSVYCLKVLTNGQDIPCPEHNMFGFLARHSQAFQNLSLTYITSLAVILLVFIGYLLEDVRLKLQSVFRVRFASQFSVKPQLQRNLTDWVSLHENSPSFS